jgi:hypothetical protein
VVIYTRNESSFRQLHEPEALQNLFNDTLVNITVVSHMPRDFWDQVRLFASVDVLIAPNGRWSPNVIWMPQDACIVELHLYKIDSWIQMFGLHRRFQQGNFMTLTGDYSAPNVTRVDRFFRRGGDDALMGTRLVSDFLKLGHANERCPGRFLFK